MPQKSTSASYFALCHSRVGWGCFVLNTVGFLFGVRFGLGFTHKLLDLLFCVRELLLALRQAAIALANPQTKKKDVVWFALDEGRPLFCFASIWTEFRGDRGAIARAG